MKNRSITLKIFLMMIGLIAITFFILVVALKVYLPNYYVNQKLKDITEHKEAILTAYSKNDEAATIEAFEIMQSDLGGFLYVQGLQGNTVGKQMGKKNSTTGMNSRGMGYSGNGNNAIEGDVYETLENNPLDIEVYTLAVQINGDYLVYEVSIEAFEDSVDIMLGFLVILGIISIFLAIVIGWLMSMQITKPIKDLNQLAKKMKEKRLVDTRPYHRKDEIGQLGESLNLLYEKLQGSIQQLESELLKERSLDKMKKQFLAQATHELKTPLAVIQGYAELVGEGIFKDEAEHNDYIHKIYHETENMSQLISDILEYSKMENGFFTIQKENVFVNPWINHIHEIFRVTLKNKGIDLEFINQVGDLCVIMDPFRMEQVLKNLLSNAIEHSTGQVKLHAYAIDGKLMIEVINSGMPIDAVDLPFIFDSFYKRKGKKNGIGLGLAIVKNIIVLHEGSYRVENGAEQVKFSILI